MNGMIEGVCVWGRETVAQGSRWVARSLVQQFCECVSSRLPESQYQWPLRIVVLTACAVGWSSPASRNIAMVIGVALGVQMCWDISRVQDEKRVNNCVKVLAGIHLEEAPQQVEELRKALQLAREENERLTQREKAMGATLKEIEAALQALKGGADLDPRKTLCEVLIKKHHQVEVLLEEVEALSKQVEMLSRQRPASSLNQEERV
jgi:hypothetical protein